MLSAEAIQEIANMAKSEIQDVNETAFHLGPNGATLLKYHKIETLTVFGLSQLLNFIKAVGLKGVFINVLSETRVQVIANVLGNNKELQIAAEADFSKVYKSFPFGTSLDQEATGWFASSGDVLLTQAPVQPGV